MRVKLINDTTYPIELSDTYGEAYIDYETVENDKEWQEFIDKLNNCREKYLKKIQKNP